MKENATFYENQLVTGTILAELKKKKKGTVKKAAIHNLSTFKCFLDCVNKVELTGKIAMSILCAFENSCQGRSKSKL